MNTTSEATLKAQLMSHLRHTLPGAVCFRHEDKMTHGIPDISVTIFGRTVWFEAKRIVNGELHETGIQNLTMLRLAGAGEAWFVYWVKADSSWTTAIVHPKFNDALVRRQVPINDILAQISTLNGLDFHDQTRYRMGVKQIGIKHALVAHFLVR